jgi:hypothetical protein
MRRLKVIGTAASSSRIMPETLDRRSGTALGQSEGGRGRRGGKLRGCACRARASLQGDYRRRQHQGVRFDRDGLTWPAWDFGDRARQRDAQGAHSQHYPRPRLSWSSCRAVFPIFRGLLSTPHRGAENFSNNWSPAARGRLRGKAE